MTWNRKLDPTHTGQDALKLHSILHNEAVVRDGTIDHIMNLCPTDLSGMNSSHSPVGNFSFLGPTGPGSSSPSKGAVDGRATVNIDREEFKDDDATAKQIGIPPTQIEHPVTRPVISQSILTQCHAEIIKPRIALFSRLRKASDALYNLLFDVLDKAALTLGAKIGAWISLTP
jgi:ATP-dependent Clp protease ATP-binding subunit ClpB